MSLVRPFPYIYFIHYIYYLAAVSKAALQTQLSSLSTSSSASSTELDTLKLRVEDTDREKRDLVGVVSRLKEDCAQRDGMFRYYSLDLLWLHSLQQRRLKFSVPT